jgi:hypothetical protein
LKPNYFFFLAAFLAVFLTAFLATFFADFAIAFLILCLNYTKSNNKKFISKNFHVIILKSDFFYKYARDDLNVNTKKSPDVGYTTFTSG